MSSLPTFTRDGLRSPSGIPDDRIYEANAAAMHFYRSSVDLAAVRTYLRHRQLSVGSEGYLVGYARPGRNRLAHYLDNLGFTRSELLAAGLVVERDPGQIVDRFRDRIVFPLRLPSGVIAGFTGRDVSGRASVKYLNTPETQVFRKSELLYGLAEGLERGSHRPVIVEGPLDALALTGHPAPRSETFSHWRPAVPRSVRVTPV